MINLNFNEDVIKQAINQYPNKQDAANSLGISIYILNKYLKKYNIIYEGSGSWKKPKSRFPEITKDWLINNWINTDKSMYQLAKEFNIPYGVLDSRRAKYGLSKRYKLPLNKDKFFDVNDIHIWYLAGLIATDGYIPNKNRNSIELSLTGNSELLLLNSIATYYNTQGGIHHYGDTHTLRIAFDGINDFFTQVFNIPPGPKTFNLQIPNSFPNEDCAKAYFLGCVDGDGCISKSKYSLVLTTASLDFISGLNAIINKYLNIDGLIYLEKRDNNKQFPTLSIYNWKAKLVCDWMYSIKDRCFYLERKYLRYKQVNELMIQSELH